MGNTGPCSPHPILAARPVVLPGGLSGSGRAAVRELRPRLAVGVRGLGRGEAFVGGAGEEVKEVWRVLNTV